MKQRLLNNWTLPYFGKRNCPLCIFLWGYWLVDVVWYRTNSYRDRGAHPCTTMRCLNQMSHPAGPYLHGNLTEKIWAGKKDKIIVSHQPLFILPHNPFKLPMGFGRPQSLIKILSLKWRGNIFKSQITTPPSQLQGMGINQVWTALTKSISCKHWSCYSDTKKDSNYGNKQVNSVPTAS